MSRRRVSLRRFAAAALCVGGALVLTSALSDSVAEAKLQRIPAPPVPYAKGGPTFEIRMYTVKPGMMDAYVKRMAEEIIPYQESIGLRHVGQFVSGAKVVGGKEVPTENLYVWIRAYPDEATRQRQYKDYYQSQWFKDHATRDAGKYTSHSEVLWVAPTATSKLR